MKIYYANYNIKDYLYTIRMFTYSLSTFFLIYTILIIKDSIDNLFQMIFMLIIGICIMAVYIRTIIMNYYIDYIEVNINDNFINIFTRKLFKSNTESTLIPFTEYTYSEFIYSVMTGDKRFCIKYKNIKFKIDDNWFTIDEFEEIRQTLKLYAKNKVEDGW